MFVYELSGCGFESSCSHLIRLILISFENDRYSTKLPFREFYNVLPDNYQLAVKRFNYLKRCLNTDKTLFDEHNKIFNNYLNDGIIEKVDVKKDNPGGGKFTTYHTVL